MGLLSSTHSPSAPRRPTHPTPFQWRSRRDPGGRRRTLLERSRGTNPPTLAEAFREPARRPGRGDQGRSSKDDAAVLRPLGY